ncbi:NUDIX hydrolase [Flavobacterium psychrotrophum]|uniref:NUDIX hydrolase n=1 Tax=Flavobacterium psychrotrophum TaxID=2294119 RepID=UPI000E31DD84|nr:NUDIX domain-containing protein [Flavobacterium psychrotrophum]
MELKDILIQRSTELYQNYLPHISIDCVVFGFHEASLKVLLVRMKGQEDGWALPGGYMGKDEVMKKAADRILTERTGATNIYLQQFRVFDELDRVGDFFKDYPHGQWHAQRFVSVGFYALVDYTDVTPVIDEYSDACEWMDVDSLPGMVMDHRAILDKALITLRRQLNYKPVGNKLLPEEFTMPELQKLYEIILGKSLNRGNFYRKMMAYNILDKQEGTRKGGAHKAPNLYKFNLERYKEALKDGFKEGW